MLTYFSTLRFLRSYSLRLSMLATLPSQPSALRSEMNTATTQLSATELVEHGLYVGEGRGLLTPLVCERPVWLFDPRRIKDCAFGAFAYVNGQYTSSLYDCAIGRYTSIAEAVVAGAYEHPTEWLSSHPFLFAEPQQFKAFLRQPEFARLAPEPPTQQQWPTHQTTQIGHDVWIGAGAFIKRGVRIGDGAVVAAHAVVTRDVPPYSIVAGQPAKTLRGRFDHRSIERLLRLQWWRYDLAPHKAKIDFRNIQAALDTLEELLAEGRLLPYQSQTSRITPQPDGHYALTVVEPLYSF